MVGAGEGPDVALEIGEKLDDDFLGGLRDEVALGHLEFIALQCARSGKQLVASAGSEDQKISGAPLAINGVARLIGSGVHFMNAGAEDLAAGFAGAVEKQAIQDGTGIDDDGMLEVESGAVIFGAYDFDVVNELLGMGIIQQERVTLRGFVSKAAAAGFFPGEMLVENPYGVTSAGKLLAAHRARRTTADTDYFRHSSSHTLQAENASIRLRRGEGRNSSRISS